MPEARLTRRRAIFAVLGAVALVEVVAAIVFLSDGGTSIEGTEIKGSLTVALAR